MPAMRARAWPAYVVQGEENMDAKSSGEPVPHANPILSVFQQGTREGNLGWEQKEDDWLRHCWGQVWQKGVDQNSH